MEVIDASKESETLKPMSPVNSPMMLSAVKSPLSQARRSVSPSKSPLSDGRLVGLARAGDQQAFARLIDRHAGLVYSIARARLRDHDSAEDLVQEVFLRVHLNLKRLQDASKVAPWMARLTRNLAVDWQRRGLRRSQLVQMVPLGPQSDLMADAQQKGARDTMESTEQSSTVNAAIDRLPDEQREVVMLHFGEELNQREIADRLGMNPMRVSRLLKRALTAMRVSMESSIGDSLRMPREVAVRTSVLVAAAAVMSSTAKASLAAAATASEPVIVSAAAKAGGAGLLAGLAAKLSALGAMIGEGLTGSTQIAAAKFVAGGTVMAGHKVLAAGGAIALVGMGAVGYNQYKAAYVKPDISRAVVQEQFLSAADDPAAVPQDGFVRLVCDFEPGTAYRTHFQMDITQNILTQVEGGQSPPPIRQEMSMAMDGETRVAERLADGSSRLVQDMGIIDLQRFEMFNGTERIDLAQNATNIEEMFEGIFKEMSFEIVMAQNGNTRILNMGDEPYFQTSEFIQEVIATAMSGYPERDLQVGDTWTRRVDMPGLPGVYATTTSTLDRFEQRNGERVAVIVRVMDLNIEHASPLVLPANTPNPEQVQGELLGVRGRVSSESHVIVANGMPVRDVVSVDIEVPMSMRVQTAQGSQVMQMRTRQQQTMTMDHEPIL
jgi:RNA polymerase sigma-70 factor (ECF subfamily)